MDHHLFRLDQHDGVGRRFVATGNAFYIVAEIQPDLVAHGAQGGKRHAAPGAGDRPVHMAEEDVPDARQVGGHPRVEQVALHQPDAVHRRDAQQQRRMVHEQEDRRVAALRDARFQPVQPGLVVPAGMGTGLGGVEEDQPSGFRIAHTLHRAGFVHRHVGEEFAKRRVGVVVADDQLHRHGQRVQRLAQRLERLAVAEMRQIAGDDGKIGVGVVAVDVGDAGIQPRLGIETVEQLARAHEVGIGQMDQFHHQLFQQSGAGLAAGPGRSRRGVSWPSSAAASGRRGSCPPAPSAARWSGCG